MPFSAVAVIIRLQSNQGVLVSFCLKYVPGNGVPSNALLMTVYHNFTWHTLTWQIYCAGFSVNPPYLVPCRRRMMKSSAYRRCATHDGPGDGSDDFCLVPDRGRGDARGHGEVDRSSRGGGRPHKLRCVYDHVYDGVCLIGIHCCLTF